MDTSPATPITTRLLRGRNWMGARRILVALALNVLLWWGFGFIEDSTFNELPKWIQFPIFFPLLAGLFGLGYCLFFGFQDFVHQNMRPGNWRDRLSDDYTKSEGRIEEFETTSLAYALAPLYVVGGYLALALIAGLIWMVFSGIDGLSDAVSSWPSWAVVIVVLLVILIFSQNKK